MTWWWVSCRIFTAGVLVNEDNKIIDGAPITQRFMGQSLDNLKNWMRTKGGYQEWEYED